MEYNTGNISTIATWIAVLIAPFLVQYGVQVDQSTLITFFTAFITILIAIWSSRNPNTFAFLGNAPTKNTGEDRVLNHEYEQ